MKKLNFFVACVAIVVLAGCSLIFGNTVKIASLTFDLPEGWALVSVEMEDDVEVARISVPDPVYDVVLPFRIYGPDYELPETKIFLTDATLEGSIYGFVCPPEICYGLERGEESYKVVFAPVESNEEMPAGMDGVWFPSTTVTDEDMVFFLATVK